MRTAFGPCLAADVEGSPRPGCGTAPSAAAIRRPRRPEPPPARPAGPPSEVGGRELAVYVAALLVIAAARMAMVGGPQFLNDSYQYLSMAENFGREHAISTSIIHFDVERASGRVPAPESTFPGGYPVLISLVSRTGLPLHWSALAISLLSIVAVLPLLRSGARALGLGANATRFCLVGWTFSAQASQWGITLYAEGAFTALTFAALVLLLWRARDDRGAPWRLIVAFLLAGAAVWVRYAGLFHVVALNAWALTRIARDRARWKTWVAALAVSGVLVAALVARNAAVTGTWQGGHVTNAAKHGIGSVLYRLGAAGYALAFGSHERPLTFPFGLFALLMVAGGIAALAWTLRALVAGRRARLPARADAVLFLLSAFLLYCGAMSYLGLASNVSLDSRMFVPVLPIALLLVAVLFSAAPRWAARASPVRAGALAALAVGYVGTNVSSDLQPPGVTRHALVAEMLALPMASGQPLSQWIASTIPRDAVVFAVEGQATGYLLGRRTISAVGRLFTSATWDEDEVRRTMTRFGAEYLILYPESVATGSNDRLDSPLFRELVAGKAPAWLELSAENPRVRVYRKVG